MRLFTLVALAVRLLVASLGVQASDNRIDALNVHELPLGDGKISIAPKRGYVMACTTRFHSGGAQVTGRWIHGDTWDLTQKLSVQGRSCGRRRTSKSPLTERIASFHASSAGTACPWTHLRERSRWRETTPLFK